MLARLDRKNVRRVAVLISFLVIAAAIVIKPPFVIKPMAGHLASGGTDRETLSPAAAVLDPIWTGRVVPTILEKAQDFAVVLPEIRANPEVAGQKYGRREATNPYNYMVKGTGKVVDVNTQSRAGTLTLDLSANGLTEPVRLQIGPVVLGTALRDATGLVTFSQFTNQVDYADSSKEMNARALKLALNGLNPSSLLGKTISFYGAFTFDPKSKSPIAITPIKIEAEQ
jgi:predicted lipoprotein